MAQPQAKPRLAMGWAPTILTVGWGSVSMVIPLAKAPERGASRVA